MLINNAELYNMLGMRVRSFYVNPLLGKLRLPTNVIFPS